MTQTFVDILHVHDGVVDQRTYRDGDAAETHGVDGQPHEVESYDGDDYRQRQGYERNQSGAQIHQEEEQHYDYEDGSDKERLLQIAYRAGYEVRLAEYVGVDLYVIGKCTLQVGEFGVNLFSQLDCAGTGLLGHGDEYGRRGVDRCRTQSGLLRTGSHLGYVRQSYDA